MTGNFPRILAAIVEVQIIVPKMLLILLVACRLPFLASARCWHEKALGCFIDDGSTRALSGYVILGEDNTLMDQVNGLGVRMKIIRCQRVFSLPWLAVLKLCRTSAPKFAKIMEIIRLQVWTAVKRILI